VGLWCGFADCCGEVTDDTSIGLGSIGQYHDCES
jgi:hypothetical protein